VSELEKHNRPYVDESLVINSRLSEIERQQREDKAEQRKHERSQRNTNRWMVIFTGLLFITSVASDIVLERQTDLNKQNTALLERQLEEANSASIYIRPLHLVSLGNVSVTIYNLGHYAATNIQLTLTVSLREFPSNRLIVVFPEMHKTVPRIGPPVGWDADPLAVNRGNMFEWPASYPLSVNNKAGLQAGTMAVTAALFYSFNNGFRNMPIADAGCFGYFKRLPLWTQKLPDGHITGSGNFEGTYPCEGLSRGMDEALDWERQHRVPHT